MLQRALVTVTHYIWCGFIPQHLASSKTYYCLIKLQNFCPFFNCISPKVFPFRDSPLTTLSFFGLSQLVCLPLVCVFPLSRLSLLKDCPMVVKTGQKNTKYWKSHCSFCDLNALLNRNKTKSISHSTIQPWYQVHGAMCRAAWLDLSNCAECKDRITELAQTKGGCGFVLFYYNQKKTTINELFASQ